ncbi:15268_t:CDS:2 [Dentiscutata erythropus]|uniref:15268_t:CDS:1 n=1 Tax=Dentiscutata erythropus TaxID=1348616 RepID=A0A9N8ZK16_9GLOM|nr:15268_t:CDS:2 [Dentiscutata erythropus]
MSLYDSTSVTYDSPLMASQYSSKEVEKKEACPKHSGERPPDPTF